MAKLRGALPPVGVLARCVRRPVFASTAKLAMLSWPRLEPYTKRPAGCTAISAVLLGAVEPKGRVEIVCICRSVPADAFHAKAATLFDSSQMTYAYLPDGC